MLIILKNGPDTTEGRRGIKLARDMAADVVLIQNAVYFAEKDRLEGFCGTAYALQEDLSLRGITETEKAIKIISYDELAELLSKEKTAGAF